MGTQVSSLVKIRLFQFCTRDGGIPRSARGGTAARRRYEVGMASNISRDLHLRTSTN